MSLRDSLTDTAISTAKRKAHTQVTPAHLTVAVVQLFQQPKGPFTRQDLDRAIDGLPSFGSATQAPEFSPEASEVLRSLTDKDAAIAMATENLSKIRPTVAQGPRESTGTRNAEIADDAHAPEPPAEVLNAALADLDALVGLTSVKNRVRELVAMREFNEVRKAEGLPALGAGLHLVFTGSPGTGKTTVARLIARIYHGLGVLPKGHMVETGRVDLIGEYVGHTAVKTQKAIDAAHGGVLFIDEAYSLLGGHERDYGQEAIATLVKAMEDKRGQFAVVAAGYTDEMEPFIESNPGLRSRFQTFIEFPDYTTDELVEIFADIAAANDVGFPPDVLAAVRDAIAASDATEDGGNARFVRSLFEEMTSRMAVRAMADGKVEPHEVHDFAVADVPEPEATGRGDFGFR